MQDDTDTSGDEVALEMDAPRMQLFNGDQAAVDNANGLTDDSEVTEEESGSAGVVVAGAVVVIAIVIGALYATGMIGTAAGSTVAGGMGAGNAG